LFRTEARKYIMILSYHSLSFVRLPLGIVPIKIGTQNNLTLLYPEYPFYRFPEHGSLI